MKSGLLGNKIARLPNTRQLDKIANNAPVFSEKQNSRKRAEDMKTLNNAPMIIVFLVIALAALGNICMADADEQKTVSQKSKRPPLLVTTVEVDEGVIQSTADFIGSTYFARVSQVATEIEGLVSEIKFAEGDKVKKGGQLVLLDSELLDTEITGARAAFEQNLVDLENARRDFNRIDSLYEDGSISEIDHDSYLAKKESLEKLSVILKSKHDKLLITKRKKTITAPFDGTILQKTVEVGEWVPKGGNVAVLADNSNIDVWVDVPAQNLEHLENGKDVRVRIGTRECTANFITFIPRGDMATRTFTAKFRLEDSDNIVEGLEALVALPNGAEKTGLVVPRDAVVDKYGETMIFLAVDKTATMVPVEIAGYVGLQAVVTGSGLEKGQQVIVRGAQRVEEGMELQFRN